MNQHDVGEELVEMLDDVGSIIGVCTRRQMRAERLAHRATYVALVRGPNLAGNELADDLRLNSEAALVVHRRAGWKDVYPSYWDLAFGGVNSAGEDWQEAAARELAEESGIRTPLVYLCDGLYRDEATHAFGRVYLARSTAELRCDDGEVDQVDEIALGELERWAEGRLICPDSHQLVLPRLLEMAGNE